MKRMGGGGGGGEERGWGEGDGDGDGGRDGDGDGGREGDGDGGREGFKLQGELHDFKMENCPFADSHYRAWNTRKLFLDECLDLQVRPTPPHLAPSLCYH